MSAKQFTTEVLTDSTAIAAMASDWDSLAQEDPHSLYGVDATMSFAWFDALCAAFPVASSRRLTVCRSQGRVLGILPTIELKGGAFGMHLGLPTELHGGRCAPLLAQMDPEIVCALLQELTRTKPGWVTLQMTILADGPMAALLRNSCESMGCRWTEQPGDLSVHFPLPPPDVSMRQSMSDNAWQNLRKVQNRAARLDDRLEIREFSLAEHATELLQAVLEIEQGSWKHEAGSAITNNPQQEAFYAALLPRVMREGLLLGLVLYFDGQPIAHHFGLMRQGVYCGLKHSHAQAQDAMSPSNLLMAELHQRLRQRGVRTFDCMGVVEAHKLRWSLNSASYQRSTFTIYNNTLRARALFELRRGARQYHRLAASLRSRRSPSAESTQADGNDGTLEVLRPSAELATLTSQWDGMVRDDPSIRNGLDSTASYCWFAALVASRDQAAHSRVLVRRRNSEVRGLLPLIRDSRGLLGSRIATVTELHGGRSGLLISRSESQIIHELLQGMPAAYPDWVSFRCTLTQGSEGLDLLLKVASDLGLTVEQQLLPPTAYVELLGSVEDFESGVSHGVLRKIRKSLRRAAAVGQLSYREYRDPQDAEALMAMVLEVERNSWKHEAGTAISTRPDQEAFYRALAPIAMRNGLLYTLALYLDDRPISYQFGLVRDGVYSSLKNSMVQAHADLRSSYLIKVELFNRLREMGVKTVDLLGVVEPHKMIWASPTPTYQRVLVTLYRRSLSGRVLAMARSFKSSIKRVVSLPK